MNKFSKLGITEENYWLVNSSEVNLSQPIREQNLIKFPTDSQSLTIDLNCSALLVVDLQNAWCSVGGWTSLNGRDISYSSKVIEPLQKLIPLARSKGLKIVWISGTFRSDSANISPNKFWCNNHTGQGLNLGDVMPDNSIFLEKGSWNYDLIDEMKKISKPEDLHIDKCELSGFPGTELDGILRNFGIRTLIFTGVCTDQCVHHTLADANFLGYSCILLEDCVATNSPDFVEKATIWQVQNSLGFVTNSHNLMKSFEKIEKNLE